METTTANRIRGIVGTGHEGFEDLDGTVSFTNLDKVLYPAPASPRATSSGTTSQSRRSCSPT